MCYDCKRAQQARFATPYGNTKRNHARKASSRPHAASGAASRRSPIIKHVRLRTEFKVMCDPSSKPGASDSARSAHEALLALYDVLARYNAAIRVKYPPSAPLARVMERSTSGWANDAPSQIQEFKHAAEDAIHAQRAIASDAVKRARGCARSVLRAGGGNRQEQHTDPRSIP